MVSIQGTPWHQNRRHHLFSLTVSQKWSHCVKTPALWFHFSSCSKRKVHPWTDASQGLKLPVDFQPALRWTHKTDKSRNTLGQQMQVVSRSPWKGQSSSERGQTLDYSVALETPETWDQNVPSTIDHWPQCWPWQMTLTIHSMTLTKHIMTLTTLLRWISNLTLVDSIPNSGNIILDKHYQFW